MKIIIPVDLKQDILKKRGGGEVFKISRILFIQCAKEKECRFPRFHG